LNYEKQTVSSAPSNEIKPNHLPVNDASTCVRVSELGLPEDGQRMISELMSFYDNNVLDNNTFDTGHFNTLDGQNHQPPTVQIQQVDNFFKQGSVSGLCTFQETGISLSNSTFPPAEFQYDQCNPSYNSFCNGDVCPSLADYGLDSPFNFTPVDYSIDPLPKQEAPLWCL
jgi:ethylene-insensitive protein 3